jgi:hypothetical protein
MAVTGDLFMGTDSQQTEPKDRLASYLGKRFADGYASKRLASALRITPKAAENLLNNHWPNSKIWQRIVALFGRDVLDAVFGPDIDETITRLRREEAELERILAEKRSRRLAVEGFDAGPRQRDPTSEDLNVSPLRRRK